MVNRGKVIGLKWPGDTESTETGRDTCKHASSRSSSTQRSAEAVANQQTSSMCAVRNSNYIWEQLFYFHDPKFSKSAKHLDSSAYMVAQIADSVYTILKLHDISIEDCKEVINLLCTDSTVATPSLATQPTLQSALSIIFVENARADTPKLQFSSSLEFIGLREEIVQMISDEFQRNVASIRENLVGVGGVRGFKKLQDGGYSNCANSDGRLIGIDHRLDYKVRSSATMGERSAVMLSIRTTNGNDERAEILECTLSQAKDLLFKCEECLNVK
jgi:hypothetical protein